MFAKQPKQPVYIWTTYVRKFVTENFQKLPNLVTLMSGVTKLFKIEVDTNFRCFDGITLTGLISFQQVVTKSATLT